jgi:tRNA (adenine22-N1)-methyltransferase
LVVTPRLPQRLRALIALVPAHTRGVADVGAGHGALSAWLALLGHRVIATEAGHGPFAELCANLARWQAAGRVEARQGHGLQPLCTGEVDTAIVAGMGARTMLGIADEAPERGVRFLVLQCMQRRELVAPWIAARGVAQLQFLEVQDHGRLYPVWLLDVATAR